VARSTGLPSRASPYSLADAFRLPSLVTLTRLPLAIAFPWAVASPPVALSVLGLAAASDVLDGWLARRRAEATPTGGLLDAITDKIFVLTVVVTLAARGLLSPLEVVLLGARDLGELPLVLRLAVLHRLGTREPRGSNLGGKLATTLQFVAVVVAVVGLPHRAAWIAATAAVGVIAAGSYWVRELRGERASPG